MSSDSPSQSKSGYGYIAKGILSNFFDAIMYSRRSADKREDVEKIQKELSIKLGRTDELYQTISRVLKQYLDETGVENLKENLDSITSFASASLEQIKNKLTKFYTTKANEINGEVESSKTLSLKSLESFVSGNYFPVREKGIILKMVEGGYEARAKYLSDGDIEYDFTLNAKNIDDFRDVLMFSSLVKSFKIPVGAAGTWISKEPVIDYEKLDRYAMTSAELSGENLICNFGDTSKQSNLKFIYSKAEKSSSLSVDFTDPSKQVDITSQPALNKNLDVESLEGALNSVLESMKSLETHRMKLLKLSVGDEDILASVNYTKFLKTVIEINGNEFRDFFSRVVESDFSPSEELKESGITKDYVSSRMKIIGEVSKELLEFLGKNEIKE